jgi:integrase
MLSPDMNSRTNEGRSMPMDPIENWLAHYDTGVERKRRDLNRFASFVAEEPEVLLQATFRQMADGRGPQELNHLLLKYYRHLVEEEHLAKTSAAQYYFVARSFFSANGVSLGHPPREMRGLETEYERGYILTQDQVKAMIDIMEKLLEKALIAFLAQTGQRKGVLTAVKHSQIVHVDSHGVVPVPPTYLSQLGANVNKERVRYRFVIGEDALRLLTELSGKSSGDWIFKTSMREIARTVDEAAIQIGIQTETETRYGRKMRLVHPHTFRKYWKHQVRVGIADSDLVNYMMGHRLRNRAYDLFTDKDLVDAYIKAEQRLSIH